MPRPKFRTCSMPGCPTLCAGGKCDKHRRDGYRTADAQRGSTAERGYGTPHQRDRERQWAPIVRTGTVICPRCQQLIAPGDLWDLGHDDVDRSLPTRPEHRACNRATKSHNSGR